MIWQSSVALLFLGFAFNVAALPPPNSVSFSPKTWFPREFERLEALSLQYSQRRPKPLAFSDGKGLVAGTSNPLAVHAGVEALKKGGNAMDACLTTALTEIVLAAGSHVSFAGVANILYHDSSTGDTYNIDGGWNKPYYIDLAQMREHHSDRSNGASVLVPGFIAAVSTASETYGRLPLSKLLEPAKYFSQKGFKLPSHLAQNIKKNYNPRSLLRTKEGKHIFTNPKTKKFYSAGDRFRQPKLAKFLKRLSKHGKDYFYRGTWAEDMVEMVQSQEGYITMEDMTEYQVTSPEPASTLYQRHHVLTSGAEWGGAELLEKMNLMELAGIGGSTDSYLTNATKLFWLASITRFSSFISFFAHSVPNGKQLLKEHLGIDLANPDRGKIEPAEELWDKIGSVKSMKDVNELMREMLASVKMDVEGREHGSSGVVVVDRGGNVCSLVHGTDSGLWGSGLFVQGVSLPSSGIVLKSLLKETRNGRRVPSGLQPVIVFKEEFRGLDEFGRRLRRDVSVTKKHKKRLTGKRRSLKHPGYTRVELPQKLVILRTHNRVRSHLEQLHFVAPSQRDQQTVSKQPEITVTPSMAGENFEEPNEGVQRQFGGKLLTYEETSRDEEKSPTKFSVQKESFTPGTERQITTPHPTDPEVNSYPIKAVPRSPHSEKERLNTAVNSLIKEDDDEENELEEHKDEDDDEEAVEEEKLLKEAAREDNSREYPHLGITDAWERHAISEERGEPSFHTGLIPVLAMACTGPSHALAIPQYLTNILDGGMSPKAALEAPTFLLPSPHSFQQDIQVEKFAFDENVLREVEEFGQPLTEVDSQTVQEVAGFGAAVTFSSGGKMLGCAHPATEGLAEGVAVLES